MVPAEFSITLQHGIAQGFAPPTPLAVHTLVKSRWRDVVQVSSSVRPDGTPELIEVPKKVVHLSSPSTWSWDQIPVGSTGLASADLLEELYKTLKDIPDGFDGSYFDTSLVWRSIDMEWYSAQGTGAGGGGCEWSSTRNRNYGAQEEHRQKFKRAIDIVNELVERGV